MKIRNKTSRNYKKYKQLAYFTVTIFFLSLLWNFSYRNVETVEEEAKNAHKPSQNFYLHVNQRWLSDPLNAIPQEYPAWGSFTKLHDESLNTQINMLNEISIKSKNARSKDEHKMALIWSSSMNRFQKWERETLQNKDIFLPIISEFSKLQLIFNNENKRVVNIAKYFSYAEENGIEYPFSFTVGPDFASSNDIILEISPSGLSMPSRDYYFDSNFIEQRESFREHLTKTRSILISAGIIVEEDFAEKVLSFETDLAYIRMTTAQSRLFNDYYTTTNLTFYHQINQMRYVKEKISNYEEKDRIFVEFSSEEVKTIEEMMNQIYNQLNFYNRMKSNYQSNYPINEEKSDQNNYTKLCVYDGDYFMRLFRLLFDPQNNSRLIAYLQYKIIKFSNNFCTKELNEEFFDYYGRKLSGQMEQKSKEKRSIEVVNRMVGQLLGKLYVNRYFSSSSKKSIEEMINLVIDVMKESLIHNDWLTTVTKDKAIAKVGKFSKKIGYPDEWEDFSRLQFDDVDNFYVISKKVQSFLFEKDFLNKINSKKDENEWFMTPQTVNAYYHPSFNEIVFPAAILRPPFYYTKKESIDFDFTPTKIDPTIPANFGAIGAVIAHEITHGYDDQGRLFDGDGNLIDWWTKEDVKLFEQKTKIMGNQSEKYSYSILSDSSEKITHNMNAQLTMGENLADLGGLSLSKKALLRYLKSISASQEVINGSLDIFFRSWANTWKRNATPQYIIKNLASDPHAPNDFRGNLVNNFEEFYIIYNVTPNDEMYLSPNERVNMW